MKERLTMGCTDCKKELVILELDNCTEAFCTNCDEFKNDYTWVTVQIDTTLDKALFDIFGL